MKRTLKYMVQENVTPPVIRSVSIPVLRFDANRQIKTYLLRLNIQWL